MNPRVKSKKDGKLLVFAREVGTCYEEVSIFNNAVDESESQRQSLSLSLVFFVSYTCLHCCFLEMVCLLLFALRCCCCSCPIPFLENNRRNEAYLLFWFSVLFMPRGGDQKNCWNYFHRSGRQAVWILRIANVHDVVQYLS